MFSGFGSFGNGQFGNMPQKFEQFFRCYPVSMMNDRIRKDDANFGGKIFLPPSALNKLTMLNIRYPMLFELTANENGNVTHGGVLEFIAEEGRAYLPEWMLQTLQVQPGSLLKIATTDIPQGQYVNIEPQSVDFLDISDPKAVLENVLRNFSTLTVNDIIEISYNNKTYRIKILEVKPETPLKGICVIETDLITDFAPPVGYVEPDYKAMQNEQQGAKKSVDPSKQDIGSMSKRINYQGIIQDAKLGASTFSGEGNKLSGKAVSSNNTESNAQKMKDISLKGEPLILDLPDGQLFFGFPIELPKTDDNESSTSQNSSVNFNGRGQSLRKSNKRKGKNLLEKGKTKAPKSPEVIEID